MDIHDVEIRVARDARSGFPCVGEPGSSAWIGFFPILKVQVEQCIWENAFGQTDDGHVGLIERLELSRPFPQYPESVNGLKRSPLTAVHRDNAASIIGTHLSAWSPRDVINGGAAFPTGDSEWGKVGAWLNGRFPKYGDWERARAFFERFKTRDLARGVRTSGIVWSELVETLLARFIDHLVSDSDSGLPFMGLGVYELLGGSTAFEKLAQREARKVARPIIAGESRAWPVLDAPNAKRWRALYQPHLPVVGARLWFDDGALHRSADGAERQTFRPGVVRLHAPRPAGTTAEESRGRGRLKAYSTARATMTNRCPICYDRIDANVFRQGAAIWCYQERVLLENGDAGVERKHRDREPPEGIALVSAEAINNAHYRPVAINDPARVRSITLSGWSQAGKGTWLLSLAGLLRYPLRSPRLKTAFPSKWNVSYEDCSMADFTDQDRAANPLRQLEALFADGTAPIRTAANVEAMRCPFLFQRSRTLLPPKRVIFIFNDIAGETIAHPHKLTAGKHVAHLGSTTDVIFLIAADELDNGAFFLARFANALSVVRFEETAVNLGQVNLILAISQIDKLKHGTADDRRLLRLLLKQPYELDVDPTDDGTKQYFSAMEGVHYDLEEWIHRNMPMLYNTANQFASVRYCGFSSFGFGLEVRGQGATREALLPFGPQPVRVADPLFWLLRDNQIV
jgi:hypothetical protein